MPLHPIPRQICLLALPFLAAPLAQAQEVPVHAQGLKEELIIVDLGEGIRQAGVFSVKIGSSGHTHLAVLLPGYPSVVRPKVENGAMTSSKLTGNFLIRSRRHLVDESIATLIVDCQSNSGDYCSSAYQSSKERQVHIQQLIDEAKRRNLSIREVWLVGTSMGTISSSFMPLHDSSAYSGAIHTASITDSYATGSYRELRGFDYKRSKIPQFFVHHRNDPCSLTTYSGAKSISEKYGIPLVTVTGGSGFQGDACQAHTEHGFKGKEKEVMSAIGQIIRTGKADSLDIQ